jgi:tRNA(His) 5'-end guanylyltransferase
MDADAFEREQRAREYFHGLRVLPGAYVVIRLDGRGFSKFTEAAFDKPFDDRFSALMVETATALMAELGGRYGYTESDEISVLLDPASTLFGGSVEKLVSVSAGIASATFTHAAGVPAHFDSRIWLGTEVGAVADYFSWRQSDAARCALNGWAYWTLRKSGASARQATKTLDRASTADKNELLHTHGINYAELPAWQRRGIGLWTRTHQHEGHDPIRDEAVTVTRRRLHVERELPMKDAYRTLIADLLGADAGSSTPKKGTR